MTADISRDPWAALDELLGVEAVDTTEETIGPVAFYGRCSTEDNQDPETSHAWQLSNAQKFVEPLGATVAAEFFDGNWSGLCVRCGGLILPSWGLMISRCLGRRRLRSCVSGSRSVTC